MVERAPESWHRVGCEWLWRVIQEPRRLGRRYLKAAPLFLLSVVPSLLLALVARAVPSRS